MDPTALAGMIFSLVLIAMIGTFITLIPLSRRLGRMLDAWLDERRGVGRPEELEELRRSVSALEREVGALTERQQFLDQLLEGKRQRLEP